jgi:hypothetical protein
MDRDGSPQYPSFMGAIFIGRGDKEPNRIPASDANLDRIAYLLEHPPTSTGGFWIAGQLGVGSHGEAFPDPANGHQRLWVPGSALVTLVYDRPLHPDPDNVMDEAGTVYL